MFRLCLSRFKAQSSSINNIKIYANYINCIDKNLNKKNYSTKLQYKAPERNQNIIQNDNIFCSPWKDIDIPNNIPLHNYVWKNVDQWWNKTAVICSMTDKSYTYGQLRVLSGRFATSLRKLNFKPGNSLAAVLPNIPEFIIIAMGASEAGIPLTLINPLYTAREINYQLKNSDAVAVITASMRYDIVVDAINGIETIKYPIIYLDSEDNNGPTGTIKFNELVDDSVVEFEKSGDKININVVNDTVILPYSSGTTGLPKGVELTHRNLVANLMQIKHPAFNILKPAIGQYQDINPIILPIFHSYGFSILCMGLSFGCKLICVPIFTPDTFLEICEKYPLTGLSVVPPIIQLMTNDPRFTKKHIENLQAIVTGATSLSKELSDKFLDKFGDSFALIKGYGLTEASPGITSGINRSDDSVGLLLPNTKIKIIGEAGKNLGINQVGEILVKGPQVMKGYFNNSQGTLDTMENDWLKTGDLGKFNDDGDLIIAGRLKELIKVNGMQVSPIELEDIIRNHDKVVDVAVIGVPHERFGEIPKAFIVTKNNEKIHEDDIKNYVAKQVIDYKRLGQVVFIEQIPKSVVGKILRKQLQNM